MAYLEFPPTTLPSGVCEPPYVIFGIGGRSVDNKLPARIPLKAVLHFVPKLAEWVLPAPEDLPSEVAKGVLRTPYVGLDIPLDVGVASLQRIILKILQSSGMAVPKHQFQYPPLIITTISIRKTWLLFELHPAGLDAVLIHLQTLLMTGSPVSPMELQELFAAFPPDSSILRLAAINFVQSYLALRYTSMDFLNIRQWSQADKVRYAPFKAAEEQYPEFGNMDSVQKTAKEHMDRLATETPLRVEELRKAAAKAEASRIVALEKAAATSSKKKSLEDMKPNSTIRKSVKWKATSDLKDDATRTTDSTTLSDTVRPPGPENKTNPVVADKSKSTLGFTLDDGLSALSNVLGKLEVEQKAGKTVREEKEFWRD